jgi:hypothetical protein
LLHKHWVQKKTIYNGGSWRKDGENEVSIVRNHPATMYCRLNDMAFHFKITFSQISIHYLAAVKQQSELQRDGRDPFELMQMIKFGTLYNTLPQRVLQLFFFFFFFFLKKKVRFLIMDI